MEEHREALDVKYGNEGRGLLAFFYGDPLEENEENERLDYKKEYEMILEIMKTSRRNIRFRSEPATVKKVRDRLHFGCEVLHFTGHGGDNSLRFEDGRKCGMAKPMKDDDLACLFRQRGNSLKLVVFGACESEECGLAVAKAGVPHVVAIRCAVSDQVAQDFVVRFYEALITGKITVQEAFNIAVITVQPRIEPARFLLLPEGANHEVIMFNDLPDHTDETPRLSRYFKLPSARRTYIGRNKLREVLSVLENDNTDCVTIIGKRGIGKTERALQACHYMGERGYFDAIFFAQCRDAVAYQRSIQNPRGQQLSRVQRLCQLVGVALDLSQDVRSPDHLWMSLRKSVAEDNKMGCDPPVKILLVLDAVNALIEDDGRREARKSLADFVDQLCSISPHLKLLVTSKSSLLQEMTGHHLGNCTEQIHEVGRLGAKQTAKLALKLYPRFNLREIANEINVDRDAPRQDFEEGLQKHKLLKLVDGHPGVLCRVFPLLVNRKLDDPQVEKSAIRYLQEVEEKNTNAFSRKRAYEIASQANFRNERCKAIWLWAISRAADEGCRYSYGDYACYYHVPWTFLSLALRDIFCDIQMASNGVGMSLSGGDCTWSNISSRSLSRPHSFHGSSGYGSDSSFCPRDLDDDELDFIRTLLHKSWAEGGNAANGGEDKGCTFRRRDSACYASEDGDYLTNGEDWFSLEAFASFSRWWLDPVMDTLFKMRKDWAAINPVKVHGFIRRERAKRMLIKTRLPWVFMLRFSVTNPGGLILGITREVSPKAPRSRHDLEMQESLITFKDGGRWTLHYGAEGDGSNTYESLSELVRNEYRLQIPYSNIPKPGRDDDSVHAS